MNSGFINFFEGTAFRPQTHVLRRMRSVYPGAAPIDNRLARRLRKLRPTGFPARGLAPTAPAAAARALDGVA